MSNLDAQAKRFQLHRDVDVSGVSGTGIVADGVMWPDGSASIRWRGENPSIVFWDKVSSVETIHGHNGATRIFWIDARTDEDVCDCGRMGSGIPGNHEPECEVFS